MKRQSLLIAAGLLLNATAMSAIMQPVNQGNRNSGLCPIEDTGNTWDLALTNAGYFAVSKGKRNSKMYFTRYGKFLIDQNHYIVNETGEYLLKITGEKDAQHLSKIKIPVEPMPPKATSKALINVNLPASTLPSNAQDASNYVTSFSVVDEIGRYHDMHVTYTKLSSTHWKLALYFEKRLLLEEGTIVFSNNGRLLRQEGLRHVYWPTDTNLRELRLDFTGSTQYGAPFEAREIKVNGNKIGDFIRAFIGFNGEIAMFYTNGYLIELPGRIAVATFPHPQSLARVDDHLFYPTPESGQAWIERENSDRAILSGALELEICKSYTG